MSQDFGDAASAEANGDPGEAVAETEGANGNEAKGDAQPAADAVDEAGGAIAPAGPSEPVHESEPSHNAGAGDSPQPDSASAGRRTIDEARPPSASNRTSTSTSARVSASVTRSSLAVPLSSMAPGDMFIRLAVERLLGMKEGKRVSGLHDAGKAALAILDVVPTPLSPSRRAASSSSLSSAIVPHSTRSPDQLKALYQPLSIACNSKNPALCAVAVDCLGKLFAYGYWGSDSEMAGRTSIDDIEPGVEPASGGPDDGTAEAGETNYPDMVVDLISGCFSTPLPPSTLQMQIVKSLVAAVSAPGGVHGPTLLKCIRTLYNVFLLSAESDVQVVAQAAVSQIVSVVMGRVPPAGWEWDLAEREPETEEPPTTPTREQRGTPKSEPLSVTYLKDAFLLLRALLKLAMKPLPPPIALDLRSHPMRSKLLSLSLIQSLLTTTPHVISVDAGPLFKEGGGTMIEAVKQYLCVGLARNLASAVPQIYDVSLDIFVRVVGSPVRGVLKKEMSVLFTELLLPILESKPGTAVTYHQRLSLLRSLSRLLSDPQILVEIYLNYDCDPEATAKENVWERLVGALARVANLHDQSGAAPPVSDIAGKEKIDSQFISTTHLAQLTKNEVKELYSSKGDFSELRRRALEVLVQSVLRGLVDWVSAKRGEEPSYEAPPLSAREDWMGSDESLNLHAVAGGLGDNNDTPSVFEQSKQRKQIQKEAIDLFNFKPKRGMARIIAAGLIPSTSAKDVARFLLNAEGINKKQLGEFLGEGDDEHIAIMHAFVDLMDFVGMRFVDALREFLQSFRLPGEAQKIDRFMLKFAERFLANNPGQFGSADTAYVLAYSVIMLNTDLHNPQIKNHMSKEEFVRNNRGIDEGKDLDQEFLEAIYDEISKNEIKMKEEHEKAQTEEPPESQGLDLLALVPVARQKATTPSLASEQMAQKTEGVLFKLLRGKKKKAPVPILAEAATRNSIEAVGEKAGVSNVWFQASHYEHVKTMFDIVWMPVLTAVSSPLQSSDDLDSLQLCLEGLRLSIRLACVFPEMDLERRAFVSTLSKFTQLSNMGEIKAKNVEAIKVLLDIALNEGNYLAESWKDVVACISQLDRFALIGGGSGDEGQGVAAQANEAKPLANRTGLPSAALESASQEITLAIDRIYTGSVKLTGPAIYDFYRAMCAVSFEEIQSSSSLEHPRMYCLQRLVEISYYNMNRIRMEWTNLWAILGDHLNQAACYPNPNVGHFAIDKLHQLAMKFMDMDELPYFKFQKDFLRPYDYIVGNNKDPGIKDLVLRCIQQLIQAKSRNMKSGWRTIFSALARAGRDSNESVVAYAFEIVRSLHSTFFDTVIANQAAPELINSLVEFCKNDRFEKISFQAIEMFKATVPRIAGVAAAEVARLQSRSGEEDVVEPTGSQRKEDPMLKYWFPILFGLYEIVMTCELEVRTRAMMYLFEVLREYGAGFPRDFWEVVCKGVLFPIFDDLRLSRAEGKFANREDMNVWLSTTLVKALREFVSLFAFFSVELNFMVDGLLDLLALCVTQENEALARIGTSSLQQFVEMNATAFDDEAWKRVCTRYAAMFEATMPVGLFLLREQGIPLAPSGSGAVNEAVVNGEPSAVDANGAATPSAEQLPGNSPPETPAQENEEDSEGEGRNAKEERAPVSKRDFQRTISKCVVHLLLIQALHETLTQNPTVYNNIPTERYLDLIGNFERSYQFAKRFNADTELRLALYRLGYMQQLPNLLKQETTAASCYAAGLLRLFVDPGRGAEVQNEVEAKAVPLAREVFDLYNSFDPETKKRQIQAWKSVIVMFLNSIQMFDDEQFARHIQAFYTPFVNTLLHEVTPEVREALHAVLLRVGRTYVEKKEH